MPQLSDIGCNSWTTGPDEPVIYDTVKYCKVIRRIVTATGSAQNVVPISGFGVGKGPQRCLSLGKKEDL